MDLISTEELHELIESRNETSLSLFMPTHKTGSGMMQDPIRLKNLLKKAADTLRSHGVRNVDEFLDPLQDRLRDQTFWQYMSDGLAVFRSSGMTRFYRVPVPFEELVIVNDRFHIKPLLPFFSVDGHYYILALSKNKIRLLEGTRNTVNELELNDVPPSLDEFLKLDEFQKNQQFHTGTGAPAPGGGVRPALYHGHEDNSDENDQLFRWFREIDNVVSSTLNGDPLVLCGVEHIHPIYKKANHYKALMGEGVYGNVEIMHPKELHAGTWKVMEPHFSKSLTEDRSRFEALDGTGKTVASVEEVLPAAAHGRVRVLFVEPHKQIWGNYDPEKLQVYRTDHNKNGTEDLLDLAAVHTIVNSGVVHVVEKDKIPGGGELAGVLRY